MGARGPGKWFEIKLAYRIKRPPAKKEIHPDDDATVHRRQQDLVVPAGPCDQMELNSLLMVFDVCSDIFASLHYCLRTLITLRMTTC